MAEAPPVPPRRRGRLGWLSPLVALVVVVGLAWASGLFAEDERERAPEPERAEDAASGPPDGEDPHSWIPPRIATAAAHRKHAAEAMSQGLWARCIQLLDTARGLDPRGDDAAEVRSLRDQAEEARRAAGASVE